mmetsp:Transcript_43979/g.107975  ORF Transcript_43979/g.107975 Transcript_43979/m.107975 type:complete len:276 (+) Transcript_43979:267-1094(+)
MTATTAAAAPTSATAAQRTCTARRCMPTWRRRTPSSTARCSSCSSTTSKSWRRSTFASRCRCRFRVVATWTSSWLLEAPSAWCAPSATRVPTCVPCAGTTRWASAARRCGSRSMQCGVDSAHSSTRACRHCSPCRCSTPSWRATASAAHRSTCTRGGAQRASRRLEWRRPTFAVWSAHSGVRLRTISTTTSGAACWRLRRDCTGFRTVGLQHFTRYSSCTWCRCAPPASTPMRCRLHTHASTASTCRRTATTRPSAPSCARPSSTTPPALATLDR